MEDDNILNLIKLNSQMSMVLRLEPSWMNLMVLIDDYNTCCCYMLSFIVDLWYYLIYTVLYFELVDDIYSVPVFCTDPYFYVFFLLFVECSKRAVIFDSTVTQASLRHTGSSGWANVSSLDWIFSFISWCLEPPAWTSFLCIFSF